MSPLMALAEKLGECETCGYGYTMLFRVPSGSIFWTCLKCEATARVYTTSPREDK